MTAIFSVLCVANWRRRDGPRWPSGYQVIVLASPGIITYARAVDEAREMARDASVSHLQGLLKDPKEILDDPTSGGEREAKL